MDEILEPYRSDENPNVIIIPEVQPPVARYVNVITEETVEGEVPIDMLSFGYVTIEAYDEEDNLLAIWDFEAEYRYVVPVEPTRDGNTVIIPEVEGVIYAVGWEPVTGTIEIPVSGLRVSAATDWENGWEWDWDAGDFETEWFFEAEIDESIIPPYRSDDDPNVIIIPEPQPPVHVYTTPLQGVVEGSVRIDMEQFGYIQIEAEDEEGTVIGFWEFMGEYITVEPVEPTRDGNTIIIPEIEGVIYSTGDMETGFEVVSGSIEIPEEGIMITSEADWRSGYEFDWDTVGEIEWFYKYEQEDIEVVPEAPVQDGNTVVIPVVEGVEYTVDSEPVVDIVDIPEEGFTVIANPVEGYVFPDGTQAEWFFEYEQVEEEVWWLPYVHVWMNDPRFNHR